MKIRIRSRIRKKIKSFIKMGVVPTVLCGCSLMGSRQDSTKISLEDGAISQLKVVDPKADNIPDLEEEIVGSNEDRVLLQSKLLHTSKSAQDLIEQYQIAFDMESDNGFKGLNPSVADPGILFFGLGGELTANLAITDDFDRDDTVEQLRESGTESCKTPLEILAARGKTEIKLDDFRLCDLIRYSNQFTTDAVKSTLGGSVDISSLVFHDLPEETGNQFIKAIFEPDANTVYFEESLHVGHCFACPSGEETCNTDDQEVMVFLLDRHGPRRIPQVSIERDGDKIMVEETILVGRQSLQSIDLLDKSSNSNLSSILDLQIAGSPVFSLDEYNWNRSLTFYLHSKSTVETTDENPLSPSETTDVEPTTPVETANPESTDVELVATNAPTPESGNSPTGAIEPAVVTSESPVSAQPSQNETGSAAVATGNRETAPRKPSSNPENVTPSFEDRLLQAYQLNSPNPFYAPNVGNSPQPEPKNPGLFQERYFTDAEISTICNKYTDGVSRTVAFGSKIDTSHFSGPYRQKVEADFEPYIASVMGESGESFAGGISMLPGVDPVTSEALSKNLVDSIEKTPLHSQQWEIRLCFNDKGYSAFLKTSETETSFQKKGSEIKRSSRASKWLAATSNGPRSSKFFIPCKQKGDCAGVFEFVFPRALDPARGMSYFNKAQLHSLPPIRNSIWEQMYGNFESKKNIQNLIVLAGGFKLDLAEKNGAATLMTSQQLKNEGYVSGGPFPVPGTVGSVYFPGEPFDVLAMNIKAH